LQALALKEEQERKDTGHKKKILLLEQEKKDLEAARKVGAINLLFVWFRFIVCGLTLSPTPLETHQHLQAYCDTTYSGPPNR
jgi:hypothetical protein